MSGFFIRKINLKINMLKDNRPNPGKLVSSLRNSGYDNVSAILDIIDNSVDAKAKEIKVNIFKDAKDEMSIVIADNGIGMDEKTLGEALKLGSDTKRDEGSDLGKFGLGLVTASWSMCKNILVITKDKKGKLLKNEMDIDLMVKKNEFVCDISKADYNDHACFEKIIGKSTGTVVILSKCDKIQNKDINSFTGRLKKHMGSTYRKFIDSEIDFFVNGKNVERIDPLMLNEKGTEVYSDDNYDFFTRKKGEKSTVNIKVVILPRYIQAESKDRGINIRNQGFYILRNNREIIAGKTLDVFVKHNSANRIRIELSFLGALDEKMGVNFTKQGVAPCQEIMDKLKQEIGGQIASIKKVIDKEISEQAGKDIDEISFSDAEKVISNKSNLLMTPKSEVEKRKKYTKRTEEEKKKIKINNKKENERLRKMFKETHLPKNGKYCKFTSYPMGRSGSIYEANQVGKIIIVAWNSDHPFYKTFLLDKKGDKESSSAANFLVYAMATAELKTFNSDDNYELLEGFKTTLSSNLRVLLS